jgi:sialic acid synthase SpsE
VVLYHCVSGYPIDFDDVCLLELVRLKREYEDSGRVRAIGFSGHHNGIAIDLLAPLLGASYVERHFTLDRAWKGSDHAASLEPGGLRRLVRDIQHAAQVWTFKPHELMPVEIPQREKLKFRPR